MEEVLKKQSSKKGLYAPSLLHSLPNLIKPISYTLVGQKSTFRTAQDCRLRRKKTYVQRVFLELVHKCSEETIQKLAYFNLYQELCIELTPTSDGDTMRPRLFYKASSPYFSQGEKNNKKERKTRHAAIKKQFLKMAEKRMLHLSCIDFFQLACTLQSLWEQAVRMVEQQYNAGSDLYKKAEMLLQLAKDLPPHFYPLEENKNFIHTSSFTTPFKSASPRLKAPQKLSITMFLQKVLEFGEVLFLG